MAQNMKPSTILSRVAAVLLMLYIVSMFFNESVILLLSPFGAIVVSGYGCLIVALFKQRKWALDALLILILSTALMMIPYLIIRSLKIGIGAILVDYYILFFYMSLFLLPVFGILAVIKRLMRKHK